jgi:hypothetical protein
MNPEYPAPGEGTPTRVLDRPEQNAAPPPTGTAKPAEQLSYEKLSNYQRYERDIARPAPPQTTKQTNRSLIIVLAIVGGLIVLGLLAVLAVTIAVGNFIGGNKVPVGALTTEARSVALDGATSAEVQINMGAGDLFVSGGGSDLVNAEFKYNISQWKPEVTYSINASDRTGSLQVRQPDSSKIPVGNTTYRWTLRLTENVPLDLKVATGAGNSELDLANLDLKNLEVDMGTGNTRVDLTGIKPQDLRVRIESGVGQITLRVPADLGVRITTEKGLGNVSADGLVKKGDVYTNAAYGKSDVTLDINVGQGVGDIQIIQE